MLSSPEMLRSAVVLPQPEGAEKRDEFSGRHFEVDAVERGVPGEGLDDGAELHRGARGRSGAGAVRGRGGARQGERGGHDFLLEGEAAPRRPMISSKMKARARAASAKITATHGSD